jgi:hypothetical protein
MAKKEKQQELPGMPESPLAKKAEEYLEKKENLENLKDELIKEFIKSGKTLIKVSRHIVKYRQKETNQIIIKTED